MAVVVNINTLHPTKNFKIEGVIMVRTKDSKNSFGKKNTTLLVRNMLHQHRLHQHSYLLLDVVFAGPWQFARRIRIVSEIGPLLSDMTGASPSSVSISGKSPLGASKA